MLKFLIIIVLTSYILFKLLGYVFRFFLIGSTQNQQRSEFTNQQRKRAPNSNLNIDYMPDNGKEKQNPEGDYVDYEELK